MKIVHDYLKHSDIVTFSPAMEKVIKDAMKVWKQVTAGMDHKKERCDMRHVYTFIYAVRDAGEEMFTGEADEFMGWVKENAAALADAVSYDTYHNDPFVNAAYTPAVMFIAWLNGKDTELVQNTCPFHKKDMQVIKKAMDAIGRPDGLNCMTVTPGLRDLTDELARMMKVLTGLELTRDMKTIGGLAGPWGCDFFMDNKEDILTYTRKNAQLLKLVDSDMMPERFRDDVSAVLIGWMLHRHIIKLMRSWPFEFDELKHAVNTFGYSDDFIC